MKKILGGCLVVFAVAMVALGVAGSYAYRASRPMVDSAAADVARADELAMLREQVRNKKPFDPPADRRLTSAQLDRFLAVQTRVRVEVGERWTAFEKKSDALREKAAGKTSEWSSDDISGVFADFASIYSEGRRAHVNSLNVHKFSDAEFSWVRLRAYEAAGLHLAGSIDTSAIEEMARRGALNLGVTLPDLPTFEVPAANLKLVKPHVAKLKEWLPMAMLGL